MLASGTPVEYRWPLGMHQPQLGLPYLYGTAGIPSDHQLRGAWLVEPGATGRGVLFAPALSLTYAGCAWDDTLFQSIRHYVRRLEPNEPNPFRQPIGSTLFIPVPVVWTSLMLRDGDSVFSHPSAFHVYSEDEMDALTEFAQVPVALWDFDENEFPGPGRFSAKLSSDPADNGGQMLKKRDGNAAWSWTLWPVSKEEYKALNDLLDETSAVSVWGDSGCEHEWDYALIAEEFLEFRPDVKAAVQQKLSDMGQEPSEDNVNEHVMHFYDQEVFDWWLRDMHSDPWTALDDAMSANGVEEVTQLLSALRESTEIIDARVRSLLREDGAPWGFSWAERFSWPER
jgi:hypothetical protein